MVVIIDLISVFIIMVFIKVLDRRQDEFIQQFKDDTVQVSDYTIRVKNMPKTLSYGDDDQILKAKLWDHF